MTVKSTADLAMQMLQKQLLMRMSDDGLMDNHRYLMNSCDVMSAQTRGVGSRCASPAHTKPQNSLTRCCPPSSAACLALWRSQLAMESVECQKHRQPQMKTWMVPTPSALYKTQGTTHQPQL